MFDASTYVQRRKKLKEQLGSGLVLFMGNEECPMNYPANPFHFRQDSSFLYFFGLDFPNLAAVIDIDNDKDIIFGDDLTIDDIVWTGPQPTIADRSAKAGVSETYPFGQLGNTLKSGQKVHFLPQYSHTVMVKMDGLLGIHPNKINENASVELIKAVVAQRNIKSAEEIKEMESALDTAYEMHTYAMRMTKPGMMESEISGAIEGIALSKGLGVSFPVIFTIHGETLHNHYHGNIMKDGDKIINDSGAESTLHYASDITRTYPVNGKFTPEQREIYEIVLRSQIEAIEAIEPGKKYREVHLHSAKVIAEGMKDSGFMKGNMDDAVEQGAHALFFPHGIGHMIGLDVHDMEGLGENYVGYDDTVERSDQFGLAYLRLAKILEPGNVVTVEPGIYFIPELIDMWKSENKFADFIDYDKVEQCRNYGGFRVEDNILVTDSGHRVLGKPIPKTVADVESECSK
ncbi:aminopeptidase P family protein [candidate division KSB1 bacterium]